MARSRQGGETTRSGFGRVIDLRIIAVVGFAVGIYLHACTYFAVVDSGSETANGEPTAPPAATATALAEQMPTATPSVLPDRTDCEEIRGTEYRSASERQFFLQNCILS